MLTNRIKKFITNIFIASFILCFNTPLSAHPRIITANEDNDEYAISFKRDNLPEPVLATISRTKPAELIGTIQDLTVASTDGYFGKFHELNLEDAEYTILFLKESDILLLATSLEDGDHAVWIELQRAPGSAQID